MRSNSSRSVIWDFVDTCDEYGELGILFQQFSSMLSNFGFDHFMMTGLPAHGEDVEQLVVSHTWPKGWIDRYRERRYFLQDPVSKFSFSSAAPFLWRDARAAAASSLPSLTIAGEAATFGLVDGIGFPMFDPNNWQAVVSLGAGQPADIDRGQIRHLYLAVLMCQMRALELIRPSTKREGRLTDREREVLTWIAAGKSYWETSVILSISEATVQTHLLNARRKLNAGNTAQAVARAIGRREIRP